MNPFEQLEYNKIKSILAEECHSSLGRELALSLQPLDEKKQIEYKLSFTGEVQNLLKSGISFNFENVSDISKLLQEFEHQTYNFEEFRKIYFNILAANNITRHTDEIEDSPLYLALIGKIASLDFLEKRFNDIFDAEGEVKDSASKELTSIRRRKKQLRINAISALNKKIEDLATSNYLHDKIVTQRDGRFVIPVKEGATSFINGIVHGRSASKSSIFIEPQEVVGLNNELDLATNEEKQEIFRIFKEFTENILASKEIILTNTKIVQELDYYFAAARVANILQAEIPQIEEKPFLNLNSARHPLLIYTYENYNDVIPFDLELGKDFKLLLISGPNTGGKTVTLKTVGLLTLMALSGLPIPAAESSCIGIFSNIFADIGDYQSLENALSTFSSHIKNIEGMVKTGSKDTLVLIDEIGAATDPEQGSALAQAILERLVEKEVLGVITTHYTALKVFAEQHDNCVNAAMQFDPEKHIPTYQFKLGLPGNSFAIEVASQLGLEETLIQRAKELTGNQNVELTNLLKKMTEEKLELSRQNYQFQLKTALLNGKIEEHQQKISHLENETKEIKKQSIREARDFLTSLQKELNREIDNIKKTDKEKRKTLLENSFKKITKMNLDLARTENEFFEEKRIPLKVPKTGQTVWVKDVEMEGEIIEISANNIKIDMNGIFLTTTKDKLFKITSRKSKTAQPKKVTLPVRETKFELKLLGYRFEEALLEIEIFIDKAVMSDLPFVRIVHGKGTGALRSKIRQYLKNNKKVLDFYSPPPQAGGDGVTVVKLEG